MAEVERVYVGLREDMIAEVAAFDPTEAGFSARECKYLVLPMGDAQFDTEWASTKAGAVAIAKEIAEAYGAKIAWV